MESIASLKTAATRAIWGDESAQEPISGQQGDVSKGEPYDAGNMEPEEAAKFTQPVETSTMPDADTKTETNPKPDTETKEGTQSEDKGKEISPTAIDSSTTKTDSTKAQNDVRDPSDPSAHHGQAAPRENVDDSSKGLDVGDNPTKFDGPGPRPIEEVAKKHGGDAGRSGESLPKAGAEKEEKDEKHNSGTGERYVRSSGLKADGGDFDAAAPGAGREADRLLEEKGIHKDSPNGGLVANENANGHANGNANGSASKEKTSLKTKIKAKFHRGSATTA